MLQKSRAILDANIAPQAVKRWSLLDKIRHKEIIIINLNVLLLMHRINEVNIYKTLALFAEVEN